MIDERCFGRDRLGRNTDRRAVELHDFTRRERLQHAQQRAARQRATADALDRVVDGEICFAGVEAWTGDSTRGDRAHARCERRAFVADDDEAIEREAAGHAAQLVVDAARAGLLRRWQLATFLARAAQRDHRGGDVFARILGPGAIARPGVRIEQQRHEPCDRPAGFGDTQLRLARVDALGRHRVRARQLDAARPLAPRRRFADCFEERLHRRPRF